MEVIDKCTKVCAYLNLQMPYKIFVGPMNVCLNYKDFYFPVWDTPGSIRKYKQVYALGPPIQKYR